VSRLLFRSKAIFIGKGSTFKSNLPANKANPTDPESWVDIEDSEPTI
jgi:hypothetical protein